MRTTFAMAKASRIPEDALNIDPDDPRFAQYVNEATQRMLWRGKYWGTYGRFALTATSQLITLPPYIDTPEKVAIERAIAPLHDSLYEFLDNGWGTRDDTLPNGSGIWETLYRGNFPTFIDVPSPGGVLTAKCDLVSDVGKFVRVLGYDTQTPPNWIRTQTAGVWEDGELIALAQGAGTNSTNQFSRITDVQPPLDTDDGTSTLNGQWWLYQSTTLLSNYQYWETAPSYKRYLIPFINSTISTVELIGKLAFVPVKKNSDYLVVGNLAALKLACIACKSEAEHNWPEANLLWNGGIDKKTHQKFIGCIQELEMELAHHLGDGRQIGINITGGGYGNDAVEPLF